MVHRVNRNLTADGPLTAEGEHACVAARELMSLDECPIGIASPFPRCLRTAELLLADRASVVSDPRWVRCTSVTSRARSFWSSTAPGHGRRAHGNPRRNASRDACRASRVLAQRGARLVVAHGLLLSAVQWSRDHPNNALTEIFLPEAPSLAPLLMSDTDRWHLTDRLLFWHRGN